MYWEQFIICQYIYIYIYTYIFIYIYLYIHSQTKRMYTHSYRGYMSIQIGVHTILREIRCPEWTQSTIYYKLLLLGPTTFKSLLHGIIPTHFLFLCWVYIHTVRTSTNKTISVSTVTKKIPHQQWHQKFWIDSLVSIWFDSPLFIWIIFKYSI